MSHNAPWSVGLQRMHLNERRMSASRGRRIGTMRALAPSDADQRGLRERNLEPWTVPIYNSGTGNLHRRTKCQAYLLGKLDHQNIIVVDKAKARHLLGELLRERYQGNSGN